MTTSIYVLDNGTKRPATKEEIAQLEADRILWSEEDERIKADTAAKVAAKAAVLERLGITAEEAAALLA
jgi:hypothetical protein